MDLRCTAWGQDRGRPRDLKWTAWGEPNGQSRSGESQETGPKGEADLDAGKTNGAALEARHGDDQTGGAAQEHNPETAHTGETSMKASSKD